MKLTEIVEMIKKDDPEFLGKMPEQKAVKIIREALKQLAKHIDSVEEGVVNVPGFGNFRIKNVDTEKNGAKVKARRVMFNKPKVMGNENDKS